MPKTYLITGVAGFIGSAVAQRLLAEGHKVYGLDNLNDYYDVSLKEKRVELTKKAGGKNYEFRKLDLGDYTQLVEFIAEAKPDVIFHPAAQASVRYGMTNPQAYCHSNLIGHFNVLEACRAYMQAHPNKLQHLVYASSSSVYGGNEKVPFQETDRVDTPQSLYAATKRADELISYTYSRQFGLPATGLRFFTVYGPWGRPDMSPMLFAKHILAGTPIPVFNHGDLWRDFTYIDDIVEGVLRVMDNIPQAKNNTPAHDIFNIGNSETVKLLDYINIMGKVFGKNPVLDLQDCPATEVYKTYADTTKLHQAVGWKPYTPLQEGLEKFAQWYIKHYS